MVVCARPRLVSLVKVCVIIVVGLMVVCPTIIAVCAVFPAASPGLGALADACFWGAAGGLCVLVLLGVWVFVFTPGSVSRVIGLVRAGVWWVVSERYRARVRHELASADARRVWVRYGVVVGEGNYYAYTRREMELRAAWVRGMSAQPFGASVNPLNPRVPMVFDGVVPGGVGRGDDSPTVPLSQK